MAFHLARSARWLALGSLLATSATAAGCVSPSDEEDMTGASTDAITDVDNSQVKNQSIGNCWIYATASWAESLNKHATGVEQNFSESYWTYWHWFDQIANGSVGDTITTGGFYTTAAEIINRYGVMAEADFIPGEATAEKSAQQKIAEAAINTSLKTGALSTPAARKNRSTVRKELNAAFGLGAPTIANMNKVFGATTARTLDRTAVTTNSTIKSAKSFPAKFFDVKSNTDVTVTLQDAIGKRGGFGRTGQFAWNQSSYPFDTSSRRGFQKRVQTALNHSLPVVLVWYVDFNGMVGNQFPAPPATPGRQGGHMVVMEDYQMSNVPGFGTLPAGVLETRPEALTAALSDAATMDFIRIKNSWGAYHPAQGFMDGYHDLYMKYLDGPIQQCEVDPVTDVPKEGTCFDSTPLEGAVFPPGI